MDNNQNPQWQYNPGGATSGSALPADGPSTGSAPVKTPPVGAISWTAQEFIEHAHEPAWYAGLVATTVVLAAVVYFITKDYFATGTIAVLGFIVGFSAGHKPRQMQYEINGTGLSIGPKTYPYNHFKSFSVINEGELSSINLLPIKRFMPIVPAYFAPADEEKITKGLGAYLPYEQREMDKIDQLSRRLRF